MRFHGISVASFSIVLLLSGISAASAQEVPVLDLNPICRGIAQGAGGAGERGWTGLVFCAMCEQRASDEEETRQDVVQIRPRR
jgi:hypothetical protein